MDQLQAGETLSDCYISDDSTSQSPKLFLSPKEVVFVNRRLDLSKISCFGFDMDYTLCEYSSPDCEQLAYHLAQEHLVTKCGHGQEIMNLKYDENIPVRGSWLDIEHGNFLIVDHLGYILEAKHGSRQVPENIMDELYPSRRVKFDKNKFFVMHTLFNMAETCLVSQMIDFYEDRSSDKTLLSVTYHQKQFTYEGIFKDIRAAIDDMHVESLSLKTTILSSPSKFINPDVRLKQLLQRLRSSGKQTFILTNSDWWYTDSIMTHLLGQSWCSMFDLVIVDASKPKFFSGNQEPRLLDKKISGNSTPIYSGGNKDSIEDLLGAKTHEIIYFGDHLPADIVECKNHCDWRTCLIVPELRTDQNEETVEVNDIEQLKKKLASAIESDRNACSDKSIFRCGKSLSQMGSTMKMFADIYTGSVCDLMTYQEDHCFEINNTHGLPHQQ